MKIKTIVVGPLETNCYLLEKEDKIIIIDPGDNKEKIESEIKNKTVVGILITHSHFDHIGCLKHFEDKYNLKHNAKINDFNYEIIKTEGHLNDSLTFYFYEENIMFTGDFIFKGAIGRTDLPGGDFRKMQNSLKKISKYDDSIIIYPGHGKSTTLGEEKNNFKYFLN